jgi:hypothetical protein
MTSDPGVATRDACPDVADLAGFVEHRLLPDEWHAVEAHVGQCAACASVVAVLLRAGVASAARAGASPRRWLAGTAAAAVILAAVAGLALVLRPASPERLLAAAARDLGAEAPDVFASFTPLTAQELDAPGPSALRGGVAMLEPAGKVLDTHPRFRWEPTPEAWGCDLKVSWPAGSVFVAEVDTPASLPADAALEPGRRYTWTLFCQGVAGPQAYDCDFEVVSPEERRRFEAARALIEAKVEERVRDLALVHYAYRQGFLNEAERAARRHVERHPDDVLGRRVLALVLRQLGSTEQVAPAAPAGR